jgi:hypothetical protein
VSFLRPGRLSLRLLLRATLVAVVATCGQPPTVVPPPAPGQVEVRVSTSGSSLDQDGYRVRLDDGAPRQMANNGTVTFQGVAAGSHEVALEDVAANCLPGPSNPLTIAVQSSATASTAFDVECGVVMADAGGTAATPDGKARIDVPGDALADTTILSVVPAADSLLPTGPDAARYVAGSAYRFRPDSTLFARAAQIAITYDPGRVPPGVASTSLRLHAITGAAWTPILGSAVDTSLHTVTGPVDRLGIYGAVAARAGILRITSATTGSDLDPDGYRLSVDADSGRAMGTNDTLYVGGLSVGEHAVRLEGAAVNCRISEPNPRTVDVPLKDTVTTGFEVICQPLTGDLGVTVSTSGSSLDKNGYTVVVDSGMATPIPPNGAVLFRDLRVGDHSVELGNVSKKCSLSGANPRSVTVVFGDTISTAFEVTCGG